jgi:neurotransmitter:Na+ symporter, NSS family
MSTERETWKRDSGYIWSMLGSAVGFANLLSFSAHCYKNGGGAFLIPYIAAILVLGVPMLILEATIGKRFQLPLVSAYGQTAGQWGRMLGWLAVISCATIGGFYAVLTGYSVAYTAFSAAGSIPQDTGAFFNTVFLGASSGLTQWGHLSWTILGATICVALFSWTVLVRKIQSGVERICSLFLPILALLVIGFAAAVCFLPGASSGFLHYLKPDFSRLGNMALWRDVFGQLFFSLSLGLGIVVGYSRHTKKSTNILRAMIAVVAGDFLISFLAGLAIFGCIGYLSQANGVPFASIVEGGSTFNIGFVIFPQILQQFGPLIARIVGPIFFFCVFIAGITGVFSIVESVAGNIQEEFAMTRRRAVSWATALMLAISIPFCMGNGPHILDALAPMVLGNTMLVAALAEIVVFLYLSRSLRSDSVWTLPNGRRPFYHLLRTAGIGVLALILVESIILEARSPWTLATTVRWIWLGAAVALSAALSRRPRRAEALA